MLILIVIVYTDTLFEKKIQVKTAPLELDDHLHDVIHLMEMELNASSEMRSRNRMTCFLFLIEPWSLALALQGPSLQLHVQRNSDPTRFIIIFTNARKMLCSCNCKG